MGKNQEISTRRPGKWLPFLVCGTIAACLVFGAATSAFAQHVSVGIKFGAPLTDVVKAELNVPFSAQTKHCTVGPVIDIRLPLGLGIEAGAMYKRFDQQSQTITTTGEIVIGDTGFPIQQIGSIAAVGKSLEFPVVAQYHFSISSMRPYVEGGVSFNHLSNVFRNQSVSLPYTLPYTLSPTRGSFDRAGLLFGAGMDLKLRRIHVTPGLRYTHYRDNRVPETIALLGVDSAEVLLGFTFSPSGNGSQAAAERK